MPDKAGMLAGSEHLIHGFSNKENNFCGIDNSFVMDRRPSNVVWKPPELKRSTILDGLTMESGSRSSSKPVDQKQQI